mmetsp:Transcript_16709/g.15069  ORF Transcript_16709/g.15069 Transcript_16709/m.15069 type:complete len:151 (+) Transcript_16709:82-534(+)
MDNAPPHIGQGNVATLNNYCELHEKQVEYILQPPNSPDLNILDLCLFNTLQKRSNKIKKEARTADKLIEAVQIVFDTMDRDTVCVTYGHLFACYNEVLICHGGNQYKSPHASVRELYYSNEQAQLNVVGKSMEEIIELDVYVAQWLIANP